MVTILSRSRGQRTSHHEGKPRSSDCCLGSTRGIG